MKAFKSLVMVIVSVCFVMGMSSVAWSGSDTQKPAKEKKKKLTIRQHEPLQLKANLECVHRGTPVEFPDDITIINRGPGTVKKGKRILWEILMENTKGIVLLEKDLSQGKTIFVPNASPGGVQAETTCKASVVKLSFYPGSPLKR